MNSFGLYESEGLFALFKFLKPIIGDFQNASALDIGANIGNHSVYFANYFDKIYSFEQVATENCPPELWLGRT